jgi:hypothetical protein
VNIHRVRRGDVAMIRDAPSPKTPLRWRRAYLQKRRLERIVLQVYREKRRRDSFSSAFRRQASSFADLQGVKKERLRSARAVRAHGAEFAFVARASDSRRCLDLQLREMRS